jgi:hypothetical protein
MATSSMDITSFVGKLLEQDDVDALREGVRVLAQAVMEGLKHGARMNLSHVAANPTRISTTCWLRPGQHLAASRSGDGSSGRGRSIRGKTG